MEHAQRVTFPQKPVMTSMPLSVETLPEPPTKLPSSELPTKIDIKDLPKRSGIHIIYLHACIQ